MKFLDPSDLSTLVESQPERPVVYPAAEGIPGMLASQREEILSAYANRGIDDEFCFRPSKDTRFWAGVTHKMLKQGIAGLAGCPALYIGLNARDYCDIRRDSTMYRNLDVETRAEYLKQGFMGQYLTDRGLAEAWIFTDRRIEVLSDSEGSDSTVIFAGKGRVGIGQPWTLRFAKIRR